jgi:hypothetical protein
MIQIQIQIQVCPARPITVVSSFVSRRRRRRRRRTDTRTYIIVIYQSLAGGSALDRNNEVQTSERSAEENVYSSIDMYSKQLSKFAFSLFKSGFGDVLFHDLEYLRYLITLSMIRTCFFDSWNSWYEMCSLRNSYVKIEWPLTALNTRGLTL